MTKTPLVIPLAPNLTPGVENALTPGVVGAPNLTPGVENALTPGVVGPLSSNGAGNRGKTKSWSLEKIYWFA